MWEYTTAVILWYCLVGYFVAEITTEIRLTTTGQKTSRTVYWIIFMFWSLFIPVTALYLLIKR